ncbi:hypothetical protein [Clostridium sp.]|uniref:hypothetical protein n=1 Tax=Clostridium sp. TaxID=1506 RepID=UPI003D6D95C7
MASNQSGLTGTSLNLSLSLFAEAACANSSTILLFPVPEIPERITKSLVRYMLLNCFNLDMF